MHTKLDLPASFGLYKLVGLQLIQTRGSSVQLLGQKEPLLSVTQEIVCS